MGTDLGSYSWSVAGRGELEGSTAEGKGGAVLAGGEGRRWYLRRRRVWVDPEYLSNVELRINKIKPGTAAVDGGPTARGANAMSSTFRPCLTSRRARMVSILVRFLLEL